MALSPQEARISHGNVSCDLPHPTLVRVRSDAGNLNCPASDLDEEEHVVGNQAGRCEYFGSREVASCDDILVGFDELRPRDVRLSPRGRSHAIAPQDIANRLVADVVAEIRQGPRNAIVAPGRVLLDYAEYELLNFFVLTRAPTLSRAWPIRRTSSPRACGTRRGLPPASRWRQHLRGPSDRVVFRVSPDGCVPNW